MLLAKQTTASNNLKRLIATKPQGGHKALVQEVVPKVDAISLVWVPSSKVNLVAGMHSTEAGHRKSRFPGFFACSFCEIAPQVAHPAWKKSEVVVR